MLYPMFMLVILSNVVMLITVRTRFASVRSRAVPAGYYSLMSGHEVPEFVAKTTRHFNNLFEVPVLFYAGCLAYMALDLSDPFPVACAWAFVAMRVIHSFIHLGYNNVLHRLLAFGAANLCALSMWISIVIAA